MLSIRGASAIAEYDQFAAISHTGDDQARGISDELGRADQLLLNGDTFPDFAFDPRRRFCH